MLPKTADDLAGKKFGRLTALEYVKPAKRRRGAMWRCKCTCGAEIVERAHTLKQNNRVRCSPQCGREDLSSKQFGCLTVIKQFVPGMFSLWVCKCKCGTTFIKRTREIKLNHRRCNNCSLIDPVPAKLALIGVYKTQAARRGNCYSLDDATAISLFTANCFYCGSVPTQKYTNHKAVFVHNGIDRVDSSIGYIQSNCVPCCKHCNWAKRAMSVVDFKRWVCRVYNHLKLAEVS